jgi:quinol monooxygenase YgiN
MLWFWKSLPPPHVVFATFTFKNEEYRKEFEKKLTDADGLKKTRAFKGCRFIECLRDNSENKIVIRQEWDSKEDQEAYFKSRQDSGMLENLKPMMQEDLVVSRFTPTFL